VDSDLKIQVFAVILCQILMYLGCFLLLTFCIVLGDWDRILIFVGFTWLARMYIGLQYVHLLHLLAILKRLRQMNRGLRQIRSLNFNIKEIRRFVRWTIGCSVKIHHHLHKISEKTSIIFSMVGNCLFVNMAFGLNIFFYSIRQLLALALVS
jgi:hypothetical protein